MFDLLTGLISLVASAGGGGSSSGGGGGGGGSSGGSSGGGSGDNMVTRLWFDCNPNHPDYPGQN